MRNDDRHRLRQHQNQITIECPSQIIQISSDSYGSLLNQNIRLGSNKICITQNGQQISLTGSGWQTAEYSYSLSSSCDFDISVSLGITDQEESQQTYSNESDEVEEEDIQEEYSEWSEAKASGLTESEIDELPLFRYKQLAKTRHYQRDGCSICLSDMQNSHFVRMLPCVHLFHQQCIDKWLVKTSLCPLCKSRI